MVASTHEDDICYSLPFKFLVVTASIKSKFKAYKTSAKQSCLQHSPRQGVICSSAGLCRLIQAMLRAYSC